MRSRVYLHLILIVIGVFCLVGWTGYQQRRRPSAWEYKFVEAVYDDRAEKELNNLGAQGWELVAVQPIGESGRATYYLKRAR